MQNEFGRFNHTGKVFCKSNWQTTKSILDGSIIKRMSPILTLDLTDACNYNCAFCIDKSVVSEKENNEIPWNELSELLKQARVNGCSCLEISGGGEPTLYSHFSEFIRLATKLNYRLALITNGSMLHKHIDILKTAQFDWIRISLDSGSAEMHSSVHNTKANYYAEILSAVEILAEHHSIGISFLVTDKNAEEIYIAAQQAKRLHVKYFEIKPLTINYKSTMHNTNSKITIVENQISLSRELEDSSFIVICPLSLQNWMNQQEDFHKEYSKCLASYYRSVITPSGVYICPNHRGKNTSSNIPSTFEEAVNFRNREINAINPSVDCCSFCARSAINTLLYSMMDSANYNPSIINYLGWPVDYGEDAIWI